MNTWQTAYEQDRQQMLQEIYKEIWYDNLYNFIGYDPISLSRVLSALWDEYRYVNWIVWVINSHSQEDSFDRKLLTDSWNDAYLDDQSDETIEALHKLLVRK